MFLSVKLFWLLTFGFGSPESGRISHLHRTICGCFYAWGPINVLRESLFALVCRDVHSCAHCEVVLTNWEPTAQPWEFMQDKQAWMQEYGRLWMGDKTPIASKKKTKKKQTSDWFWSFLWSHWAIRFGNVVCFVLLSLLRVLESLLLKCVNKVKLGNPSTFSVVSLAKCCQNNDLQINSSEVSQEVNPWLWLSPTLNREIWILGSHTFSNQRMQDLSHICALLHSQHKNRTLCSGGGLQRVLFVSKLW